MQINRTQNQPNFRAKLNIHNKEMFSFHTPKKLKPRLNQELRQLRQLGDDTVHFTTFFNPRREKPFAVMCKLPGLDIPILHHDLDVENLSQAGALAMKEAQEELAQPIIHATEHLQIEKWQQSPIDHLKALFSPRRQEPYAVMCDSPKLDTPILKANLSADNVSQARDFALNDAVEELSKPVIFPPHILKLQEWAHDKTLYGKLETE